MVAVAVRDQDDVSGRVDGRIGEGTVALERPELRPEERVGEDSDAVDLDEDGGVAQEPDRDYRVKTRSAPRPGTCASRSGPRSSVTSPPSSAPALLSIMSSIVSS